MFGEIDSGTVKNLNLDTIKVNATSSYIGALAGVNGGTITDCAVVNNGTGLVGLITGTSVLR